ncbi:hypothetical protein JCM11491_002358, partial [Sporobolomyces phaffii]
MNVSLGSSSIEPFPALTDRQHARLDRIISALDDDATTWAEFKRQKDLLDSDSDDDDDEDIFGLSLKLVFEDGVTWKDKWHHVNRRRRRPSSSSSPRRAFLVPKTASSGSTTTTSGDDVPPPASSRADQLRAGHLVASHFDAWRDVTDFHSSRLASVDRARNVWLLRCAIQDWRAKLVRRRRDHERRDRELALRTARHAVVAHRDARVVRRAIDHWRVETLESRAVRFRVRHLALDPLRRWATKLGLREAHVETLESVADERWTGRGHDQARSALGHWRTRANVARAERAVRLGLDDGRKRAVVATWADKTRTAIHLRSLEDLALRVDARRLASSAFSAWRTRHSHTLALSIDAADLSTTFALRLATRSLRAWSRSTRAAEFSRARTATVARASVATWVQRLDHVRRDLAAIAAGVVATHDARFVAVAFDAWRGSVRHRTTLAHAAAAVARTRALAHAVARWTDRKQARRVDDAKATVVREFFVQRHAMRTWLERVAKRNRARWIAERVETRKREALEFWKERTQQAQRDRRLVATVQTRNRHNTLRERLATWKEQVIVRKELERESTILYESRLAESAFQKWIAETGTCADNLARADRFRAIKLEELRDVSLHRWLAATRRSLTLKARLTRRLDERRQEALERAFAAWRENRLSKFEVEVRTKVDAHTRRAVLDKWQGATSALTALRARRKHLLAEMFSRWKRWTPATAIVTQAVEHDSTMLTRCAVQRWSLKTSYRRAFRNT